MGQTPKRKHNAHIHTKKIFTLVTRATAVTEGGDHLPSPPAAAAKITISPFQNWPISLALFFSLTQEKQLCATFAYCTHNNQPTELARTLEKKKTNEKKKKKEKRAAADTSIARADLAILAQ